MKNICSLHFNFIFSNKTFIIFLTIIGLSTLSFLYFSNFNLDSNKLIIEADYYKNEYIFESISFIKLVIIIFSVFLTIESFSIVNYDYFLLSRITKTKFIITKLLVVMGVVVILTILLILIMWIIPLSLTPYFFNNDISYKLLFKTILFSVYYLTFSIVILLHIKSLFSLIIIIMGYFISITTIDFLIDKSSVSGISSLVQLVFIDLTKYNDYGYDFLYSETIIIAFICLFVIKTIYKYLISDI